MASLLVNAIVGALSLLLGRRLFWLFVGAAGFLLGSNLAFQLLQDRSGLIPLIVALAAGLLGAALALFAQRLALAIAGFVAGGYLLLYLADLLGMGGGAGLSTLLVVILFLLGGLIGAALFQVVFDLALVLLSSALGATLLTQAVAEFWTPGQAVNVVVFLLLLVIGVAVQWGLIDADQAAKRE